jgi:hypothetical protein
MPGLEVPLWCERHVLGRVVASTPPGTERLGGGASSGSETIWSRHWQPGATTISSDPSNPVWRFYVPCILIDLSCRPPAISSNGAGSMPDRILTVTRGDDFLFTALSQERIVDALKYAHPGLYVVEEGIAPRKLFPSDYSSERWGVALVCPDGTVVIQKDDRD